VELKIFRGSILDCYKNVYVYLITFFVFNDSKIESRIIYDRYKAVGRVGYF